MSPGSFIHETATVEDGAVIGTGSKVWHHCHIRSGARIGESTNLGKGVYVDNGARVGSYCKIQNNVSIYNGVDIADRVFVGPSAVFTNDRSPRAFKEEWTLSGTVVAEGASIGANATILCGVTIGSLAMIAAGAVVTRDVASRELVAGNPARRMGWVCDCGAVVQKGSTQLSTWRCAMCGLSG